MRIESGIPIPQMNPARTECGKVAERMKPGDSVLLDSENAATRLRYALNARQMKPVVRKVEGGWRVWRTE